MTVPKELTRFERWRCELALDSESRGPLVARFLPLFEALIAAGIVGLALWTITPDNMTRNAWSTAFGGMFFGVAAQDLFWPRNQRILALLYRACLEDRSDGERERAPQA